LKLFVDANILFSASLSEKGVAQALLVAAESVAARCVCSERAFAEAHRNLSIKAAQSMRNLELLSQIVARVPEPSTPHIEAARAAGVVEKDAAVFGAALECGADWFITGDVRHFGHLFGKHVEGVLVLPLREAVDRLATLRPQRKAPR
jgi:uncharacterized protein